MIRRILLTLLLSIAASGLISNGAAAQVRDPAKTPFAAPADPGVRKPVRPANTEQSFWQRIWAPVVAAQDELHRSLANAVARIKSADPISATLFLATISFVYGVLHAAGPGHGKMVISSYVLANERTVRRGILLSFMSAFVQAAVAIAFVLVLSLILKLSRLETRLVEPWLETASWALVAGVGIWLLTDQVRRWRRVSAGDPAAMACGHTHHAGEACCGHQHHAHAPGHAHVHQHAPQTGAAVPAGAHGHDHAATAHDHVHDHDGACCGHAHMPAPSELEGEWSWRKAISIAVAAGIRPCTGAIAVLVFASSVGLFWAGIVSTLVMALGTAITVSALAALAVGSRELATRLFGGDGRSSARIRLAMSMAGSLVLVTAGVVFFIASLTAGPGPL